MRIPIHAPAHAISLPLALPRPFDAEALSDLPGTQNAQGTLPERSEAPFIARLDLGGDGGGGHSRHHHRVPHTHPAKAARQSH